MTDSRTRHCVSVASLMMVAINLRLASSSASLSASLLSCARILSLTSPSSSPRARSMTVMSDRVLRGTMSMALWAEADRTLTISSSNSSIKTGTTFASNMAFPASSSRHPMFLAAAARTSASGSRASASTGCSSSERMVSGPNAGSALASVSAMECRTRQERSTMHSLTSLSRCSEEEAGGRETATSATWPTATTRTLSWSSRTSMASNGTKSCTAVSGPMAALSSPSEPAAARRTMGASSRQRDTNLAFRSACALAGARL
mmetsp:Transcript_23094/g.74269  ORF Transcript_23094/g.74269 Transcript_23094/m.74269 type:complete len:261 (+) Transcript_23094:533-1315(+)